MAVTKPNRDPLTLEKIRAALPTHIMLTPGVHKLKAKDVFPAGIGEGGKMVWHEILPELIGKSEEIGSHIFKRPIPPPILDNQAWWVAFDMLAEIPPHGVGGWLLELERGITDFGDIRVLIHNVRGLFYGHTRRFRTKDDAENAIELLGGQNRIIKELEVGRLYDKWLLEQMEDV